MPKIKRQKVDSSLYSSKAIADLLVSGDIAQIHRRFDHGNCINADGSLNEREIELRTEGLRIALEIPMETNPRELDFLQLFQNYKKKIIENAQHLNSRKQTVLFKGIDPISYLDHLFSEEKISYFFPPHTIEETQRLSTQLDDGSVNIFVRLMIAFLRLDEGLEAPNKTVELTNSHLSNLDRILKDYIRSSFNNDNYNDFANYLQKYLTKSLPFLDKIRGISDDFNLQGRTQYYNTAIQEFRNKLQPKRTHSEANKEDDEKSSSSSRAAKKMKREHHETQDDQLLHLQMLYANLEKKLQEMDARLDEKEETIRTITQENQKLRIECRALRESKKKYKNKVQYLERQQLAPSITSQQAPSPIFTPQGLPPQPSPSCFHNAPPPTYPAYPAYPFANNPPSMMPPSASSYSVQQQPMTRHPSMGDPRLEALGINQQQHRFFASQQNPRETQHYREPNSAYQ